MVAQANRMNEHFREAMERPAELVKEYPLASMLLMFGMGLGVGVVVSSAICSSLEEMSAHESSMTEKLKRQVYDALSHVISPSALRQIQSYTG
jgi:fructoselysine-6-P-deglycase FrlB-like protein